LGVWRPAVFVSTAAEECYKVWRQCYNAGMAGRRGNNARNGAAVLCEHNRP
jgi:hypothetical protein